VGRELFCQSAASIPPRDHPHGQVGARLRPEIERYDLISGGIAGAHSLAANGPVRDARPIMAGQPGSRQRCTRLLVSGRPLSLAVVILKFLPMCYALPHGGKLCRCPAPNPPLNFAARIAGHLPSVAPADTISGSGCFRLSFCLTVVGNAASGSFCGARPRENLDNGWSILRDG